MKSFFSFINEGWLSASQQHFLDDWSLKHQDVIGIGFSVDASMSKEDFDTVKAMQDYEMLKQDVQNYLADKIQFGVGNL